MTAITSRSTSRNFSGPHKKLLERNLVTEESNQYQYRFEIITDLDSGKPLFQIEHEIRSMTHPLYARPLVNRNPAQTNRNYVAGPRRLGAGCDGRGDGQSARREAPEPHRGRGSPRGSGVGLG